MIREEMIRLFTWEERHRRLAARLLIALGLTLVVLVIGSVLIWVFEGGVKGGTYTTSAVPDTITAPCSGTGTMVFTPVNGGTDATPSSVSVTFVNIGAAG